MKKEFLSNEVVRDNSLILAKKIYDDGFNPDFIYVPLRGGAYLGNVMSEFFKIVNGKTHPFVYAAVIAQSYTGVHEKANIKVHGWTYPLNLLTKESKILFVDDIFDSGTTINALVNEFLEHDIPRNNIKVAVHDYKIFHTKQTQHPIQPDYWCRKHDVYTEEDNVWIHYLSHELQGLSREELEREFLQKNPALRAVFDGIEL